MKMSDTKEVKACMNCGSRNITASIWSTSLNKKSMIGKKGVYIKGVEGYALCPFYFCKDCNYVGNPIIFDSEEDRLKFVELKRKEKEQIENAIEGR